MGLTVTANKVIDFKLSTKWEVDLVCKRKTATEVTFSDDPIALSWASYHVWLNFPQRRWVSLNDVKAHEHDRAMAAETRCYYRDKLMMQTLKGKPLSEYQTTLYDIVSGEAPIISDQIGIIMKLPYFYVEDTELADVFGKNKALTKDSVIAESRRDTITPLRRILCSRKNMEVYQYWFANSAGEATVWIVNSQNTLKSLVDSLFNQGQPMEVQALWHYKRHFPSGHISWNLGNVELLS
jgi:hypothetical protein